MAARLQTCGPVGLFLFTPPLHAQYRNSTIHTEILYAQELVALLAESYTGMAAACNLLTEWHAILGGQSAAAVSATAVGTVKDLFVSNFDANVADAQLRTVCRALLSILSFLNPLAAALY
jgi:hypothetical protein